MISHKHKFIFIHIPRTGGTSISDSLGFNGYFKQKHRNFNDLKANLTMGSLKSYFKFTFIRNPWAIMISKYKTDWYNSSRPGWGGEIGINSGKGLKHFLLNYKHPKHERGDTFFDYFDPTEIDFIGRYENRVNDLKFISSKINVNINPNFFVKMPGSEKNQHYTDYYDDETRDMVFQKYEKEIKYFGYKFGD